MSKIAALAQLGVRATVEKQNNVFFFAPKSRDREGGMRCDPAQILKRQRDHIPIERTERKKINIAIAPNTSHPRHGFLHLA